MKTFIVLLALTLGGCSFSRSADLVVPKRIAETKKLPTGQKFQKPAIVKKSVPLPAPRKVTFRERFGEWFKLWAPKK